MGPKALLLASLFLAGSAHGATSCPEAARSAQAGQDFAHSLLQSATLKQCYQDEDMHSTACKKISASSKSLRSYARMTQNNAYNCGDETLICTKDAFQDVRERCVNSQSDENGSTPSDLYSCIQQWGGAFEQVRMRCTQ